MPLSPLRSAHCVKHFFFFRKTGVNGTGRIHPFLKHNAKMTQTSPVYRCESSSRSYQLRSMNSLKLLMIYYMHWIPSVHRVIHSIILPSSARYSKGCPHGPPLLLFNRSTFQREHNDTSHPSLSSSNRVSRPRAFASQPHTENTLSGILSLRGS